MAASEDLINFDIIENQKENIQSLPGGRSAKELARIFSPRDPSDKFASPSPNETRTLNDAIRQEYEAELQAIDDSDDPLDVYDRYVKWTLNAYPSAQATAESGLLPLLERAVKTFLSSPHYKNDPRYLRLWLHYIRLFSDSPRETFAFLARHHIGEGLALFYEEFAAWLEGAGRWTQAEEVYRLGVDREARPTERLIRKYSEFQKRYEQRTQDNGPSSPALPAVRPALAAKVDPFSLSAAPAADPQAQRPAPAAAAAPRTKSGKPKMAIFSDVDSAASQPAVSGQTKGWDSIGSIQERRKENSVEAKPWAGETLKAGKKPAPKEKMTIFRDEIHLSQKQCKQNKFQIIMNPAKEISFEELRAMHRGWMNKDWRSHKAPLKQISGNVAGSESQVEDVIEQSLDHELPEQFSQKLKVKDPGTQRAVEDGLNESKAGKARKMKLREVKGETQTIKMKFDSPTGSKIRRKSTAEPTMTIHTRAATDEIYSIFNQPLKAETENVADSSDFEDDDYTSAGESAGESTCTGRISVNSSDFGDDETTTFHRSDDEAEEEDFEDQTQAESVVDGEWTQFSTKEDLIPAHSLGVDPISPHENTMGAEETTQRERFVPEMPEDYNPPYGPYRDPAVVAQNRLPFMTPIVEQTEHSFPSMTAARNNLYNTKTPSKPQMGNLFTTPLIGATPQQTENLTGFPEDVAMSPTAKKARSSLKILSPLKEQHQHRVIINDAQCNPTDKSIRNTILQAVDPPLASYPGYHGHPEVESHYAPAIQKFVKTHVKRPRSGDEASFDVPILELPGAQRCYIIRRELGAGAYAPVYLAESVDSLETCPSSDSETEPADDDSRGSQLTNGRKAIARSNSRYGFEAIKLEVGPPNAWEFYMIRIAHERTSQLPELSRATDSIIRAHELHVYKGESILVEDYRGQGTLLDLVNLIRNESITANGTGEGGLDEVLAMFFTVELFRTVEALHSCGILHGDIKADNCLIRFDDKPTAPSLMDVEEEIAEPREIHYSPRGLCGWRNKGLSLIDFGRGIDMRAFQPSVQFIADWETGEHECNEIRELRPWTHQIDLYGLAGTVHVMLFGKYIESTPVRKSEGGSASVRTYRIRESLKRYWDREIWTDVFDLLLNPCTERWARMELDAAGPDLVNAENQPILPVTHSMRHVREKMEAWLLANAEKKGLGLQIRKLEAVFAEKKKRLERS
ncbi:putative checkpoint protein kinase (SldA) [Aspergillus thermomutatus]|uniref:BUB protein kinase n=1 Tax=Aspergillus thermomutatus TaxID=41047 RepID=A0A397G8V1_ASPTH|nr:uncharacterized protein CDV56_102416 [Aspergillus thermomutatus]RHZ47442.1 hypothetical protein CDV56_102416 [Aspergillus thermomutatus]